VLNVTIDRFAYAFISPRDDGQVVFQAKDGSGAGGASPGGG